MAAFLSEETDLLLDSSMTPLQRALALAAQQQSDSASVGSMSGEAALALLHAAQQANQGYVGAPDLVGLDSFPDRQSEYGDYEEAEEEEPELHQNRAPKRKRGPAGEAGEGGGARSGGRKPKKRRQADAQEQGTGTGRQTVAQRGTADGVGQGEEADDVQWDDDVAEPPGKGKGRASDRPQTGAGQSTAPVPAGASVQGQTPAGKGKKQSSSQQAIAAVPSPDRKAKAGGKALPAAAHAAEGSRSAVGVGAAVGTGAGAGANSKGTSSAKTEPAAPKAAHLGVSLLPPSKVVDPDLRVHNAGPASLHHKKRIWTAEEDAALADVVQQLEEETEEGKPIAWNRIDKEELLPGRNSKQCRDRWVQHLKGDIRKGEWTEAEDAILYEQIEQHGTKWSEIARAFPGRTDHDIKNHFYATKRKLARRQQKERQVAVLTTPSSAESSSAGTGAGAGAGWAAGPAR